MTKPEKPKSQRLCDLLAVPGKKSVERYKPKGKR